jgi:hypothetical protein
VHDSADPDTHSHRREPDPDATAVPWHGIELGSYFDAAAGCNGGGTRLSPYYFFFFRSCRRP